MLNIITKTLLAVVLVSTMGIPATALPQQPSAQPALSLDEAAAQLRKRTGGQILSAQQLSKDGSPYYRFKVKQQGRIRVMYLRPDGSSFKP